MRRLVALAVMAGTLAGTPATGMADQWETLLKRTDTTIDLNVTSIERGPNGGAQASFLTMHAQPQTTPDGALYKNSTQVLELDCAGQRSWLHGVAYEMASKLVALKKYPGAAPFRFMPPETLGGATERAACASFRRRGSP